jgi:hypothetical protein
MLSEIKRQEINLQNCCIWLVNLFELMQRLFLYYSITLHFNTLFFPAFCCLDVFFLSDILFLLMNNLMCSRCYYKALLLYLQEMRKVTYNYMYLKSNL